MLKFNGRKWSARRWGRCISHGIDSAGS
jgi:hypothetical protein